MPEIQDSNDFPSISEMLREGLQKGKRPSLTISSDSMFPLLRRGDQIGLQEIELPFLKSGQILTFAYKRNPHDIVTHRYAGTIDLAGEKKLVTWADRTLMFDDPLDIDDIIGRVIWRKRNGRQTSLENGRAAWLSQKLYQIACWELKIITNLDLETDDFNLESIGKSEALRKKSKVQNRFRFLRRLTGYWAQALSFVVDQIA